MTYTFTKYDMKTILRLSLFTILCFSGLLSANAQYQYDDYKPVTFGLRAGVNMSTFGAKLSDKGAGLADLNSKVGFMAGLTVDFAFNENIYILTGADFALKGATEFRGGQKRSVSASFINLPIHFGYKLKIDDNPVLVFRGGPYLGFGMGGTTTNKVTNEKMDTFQSDFYKKFDYGLGAGVGAEFNKLVVEVGYNFGLADLSEIGEKVKARDFYLTFGYKF